VNDAIEQRSIEARSNYPRASNLLRKSLQLKVETRKAAAGEGDIGPVGEARAAQGRARRA
jgi:hypothetical protein